MIVRQAVYDTYWKTAAERQEIFFRRLAGETHLTNDSIFQKFKFCNVFRASDRVSQFLIKNVIYSQNLSHQDTLFRIFLYRLLNKFETWQTLESRLGLISLVDFSPKIYAAELENIKAHGSSIYGNAFILCATKAFGFDKKHHNHLALLDYVFNKTDTAVKILNSKTLKQLFETLRELPLIGNFMAYQLAIDFNYSDVFQFDENDFTVAGPGALRGIQKCFIDTGGKSSEYIIQFMVENQQKEFDRLGLKFKNLWGRSMHAIDCQGWFCETDKYSREKFPNLISNRTRIKAEYKPTVPKIKYFYPPKWGIKQ